MTNKDRTSVTKDRQNDFHDDIRQTGIPSFYDFYTRPSASQRPSGLTRRREARATSKFPRSRSREPRYRAFPLGVLISNLLSHRCRYSSMEMPSKPRRLETSQLPVIPSSMRPTRKIPGNKSSQMPRRPQKKATLKPSESTSSVLWRTPRTSAAPAA